MRGILELRQALEMDPIPGECPECGLLFLSVVEVLHERRLVYECCGCGHWFDGPFVPLLPSGEVL
jgi:hypothetical protein